MNKSPFIAVLILIISSLSCVQREDGMGIRTNPFDPGGEYWTENAVPEVSISVDTLWTDGNIKNNTGNLPFTVKGNDLNFPYDTITGHITVNGIRDTFVFHEKGKEYSLTLSNLKPDTTYRCTVSVVDCMNDPFLQYIEIATPESPPPSPPDAITTSGEKTVTLTWPSIQEARFYTIRYTNRLSESFDNERVVEQSDDSLISFTDSLPSTGVRYYILSSTNEYGTSVSPDTLIGRVYSNDIIRPQIRSISLKYVDHIRLELYVARNGRLNNVELYRSTDKKGPFRLIDTIPVNGSSGYLNYSDSVNTADTFYYYITCTDFEGRCSYPSTTAAGALGTIRAPSNIGIVRSEECIEFSWASLSGAEYYRIYRSHLSCTEDFILLNSTETTGYTDCPSTSDTYYYQICGVDPKNIEGKKSTCYSGKITIFSAPGNVIAENKPSARHVTLSWDSILKAEGYVLFRKEGVTTNGTFALMDTITGTRYSDSLFEPGIFSYKVAAFDERGVGVHSRVVRGVVVQPGTLTAEGFPQMIRLEWLGDDEATYKIYRTNDTATSFTFIASTVGRGYYDRNVGEFIPYYYRITVMTPNGESVPGSTAFATPTMHIPSNIEIVTEMNEVHIQWNAVAGADSYIIYRSDTPEGTIVYKEVTGTTCIDTIGEGSFFYYRIAAKNGVIVTQASDAVYGGVPSLPLPPLLASIHSGYFILTIKWKPQSGSAAIDGYHVYRSTQSSTGFERIGTTTGLVLYDTVPDTIRYYYCFSSFNSIGESTQSKSYSAQRMKPQPPQNVTATVATMKDHIRISWSPVSDIPEYGIYRALDGDSMSQFIGKVDGTVYYDSTCETNTVYLYGVVSNTGEVRSGISKFASGIRLGPPALYSATTTPTSITINWFKLPFSLQQYRVYRSATESGQYLPIGTATDTTFTDESPLENNNYYKVSAVNGEESDLSSSVLLITMDRIHPTPVTTSSSTSAPLSAIEVNETVNSMKKSAPRPDNNGINEITR